MQYEVQRITPAYSSKRLGNNQADRKPCDLRKERNTLPGSKSRERRSKKGVGDKG